MSQLAKGAFVGREREMALLRAGVDDALAGHGRLLLLIGEPGIGKTRTAEEVAAYAMGHGARVLWGRCYEEEGAPAFWPWVQVIRSATQDVDAETLRGILGYGGPEIAAIVPELHHRLPDLPAASGLDSPQARFRLFDGIAGFLENLGRRTPLVVILDDLQGADHPSLVLLEFIARRIREVPLLLLGAYRDIGVRRDHPLGEMFAEALRAPRTDQLALRGFSEVELGRFIEASAGVRPASTLTVALHKLTEGNPLFVTEYVRLLLMNHDASAIGDPHGAIAVAMPRGVQAVIRRRQAPLSAACRAILRIAAVMGREFRVDALALAIAMQDPAPLSADGLEVALHEAVAAGMLVERASSYRFTHALIRETLYEELSSGRRTQLHRQVGEALERVPDTEEHLAELAYHFFEAGRDGDNVKGVAYAQRAGDRALGLLAYEEAIRLYQMGLQALDRDGSASERRRCELLLALGEARKKSGTLEAAKPHFLHGAEIARRLREVEGPQIVAQWLSRAVLGLAPEILYGNLPAHDPALVSLFEEAISAWDGLDSALHARALARLSLEFFYFVGDDRKPLLSQQAVAMARRVGDRRTLAYTLGAQHAAIWGPENCEQRIATTTEMIQWSQESGDRELLAQGHAWRCIAFFELGDIPAAEVDLAACRQLAEVLRQPQWWWRVKTLDAVRAIIDGRFADAEQNARDALAIGESVMSYGAPISFLCQMFVIRDYQGRLAELAGMFGPMAQASPAVAARCTLAYMENELQGRAEGQRRLDELWEDRSNLPHDMTWLLGFCQLASLCAALDDRLRAAWVYEVLLPVASRWLLWGEGVACVGPVSHYLGMLASTLSRWDEAAQHFETALAATARFGLKPLVARTQYEYAAALHARGEAADHERARAMLAAALDTARALGMKGLAEKALALSETLQPLAVASPTEELKPPAVDPRRKPQEQQPETNVFRCDGDYWTIAYDGSVLRLKDSKGLQYIAYLLHHPGQEFHALDLIMEVGGQESANGGPRARSGGTGPQLDAAAKAAYKARLEQLRDDLAEAEGFDDQGRIERARTEIEGLTQQLAAALGLGGRDRAAATDAERARWAVTKRIKGAVQKIGASNPQLARHLGTAISTGLFCVYELDAGAPISWLF